MAAGESARNVASRQRREAERLQRSAELWERGAEGEEAVARALEALPNDWIVLHDLPWPGRQRANLDHVVIGSAGVFVVDAKNWTGRIEVRDQVLFQNGRRRESAVSSATAAAIAVQQIVPATPCCGVLCFVRDEPMEATSWNVTVCSTSNLVATLTERPNALDPDDVRRCADAIRGAADTHALSLKPSDRRNPERQRRTPRKGRPVLALIGGLLLIGALLTGGFQKAADWASERLVEVIVPDAPAQPTPTTPARKQRQQQENKAKQQGKQG